MFLRTEIQLIRPFWIHKGSAVREVNPRWKNLGLGSDSVAAHLPSMGELPSSISPPYPYTEKKKKFKLKHNGRALLRGLNTPSIAVCCNFMIHSIAKYCWIETRHKHCLWKGKGCTATELFLFQTLCHNCLEIIFLDYCLWNPTHNWIKHWVGNWGNWLKSKCIYLKHEHIQLSRKLNCAPGNLMPSSDLLRHACGTHTQIKINPFLK